MGKRGHRRFWLSVLVMGGVHAWLLGMLPSPIGKSPPRIFEVQLTERTPVNDPTTHPTLPPEPEQEPQAQLEPELASSVTLEEPEVVSLAPDDASPIQSPTVETTLPPVPLQLDRSRDWSEWPDVRSGADSLVSAFRPRLLEGIQTRRDQHARSDLLQGRGVALNGLAVDDYNALEGTVSNHIKTDAGCFDLHDDSGEAIGPTGFEKRWWRTKCKDLRSTPFQMDALEFDSVGRVLVR